jgi:hypothetical protein
MIGFTSNELSFQAQGSVLLTANFSKSYKTYLARSFIVPVREALLVKRDFSSQRFGQDCIILGRS